MEKGYPPFLFIFLYYFKRGVVYLISYLDVVDYSPLGVNTDRLTRLFRKMLKGLV